MIKGIAIANASCLFDDKKSITIRDVIQSGTWTRGSTILMIRRDNGKHLMVHGAGKGYDDMIDNSYTFIHDQRRTRVCDGLVVAKVSYNGPEDVNTISKDILDYKAPIWVFK